MALYLRATCILTCLASLVMSGCCCTQGMTTCSGVTSCSTCPTGNCGAGPLMGLASCRGGCGEVYVDEWISEPPCIDDCGYCDTGCGQCRSGRPVRSLLRLLWGAPYTASCGCARRLRRRLLKLRWRRCCSRAPCHRLCTCRLQLWRIAQPQLDEQPDDL